MFKNKGWWLPDGDECFPGMFAVEGDVDGRGSYQHRKLRLALKQVMAFRHAVDIGGHVGIWSWHLAKQFDRVTAFEPTPRHWECFQKNVLAPHVTLHTVALGASAGAVNINAKERNSGATHVAADGALQGIPLRTLDSYKLEDVDFIKIDVEGYETFVLQGARETLARCRPVMIVEAKPGNGQRHGLREQQALEFLLGECGYRINSEISGDFVLRPVGMPMPERRAGVS